MTNTNRIPTRIMLGSIGQFAVARLLSAPADKIAELSGEENFNHFFEDNARDFWAGKPVTLTCASPDDAERLCVGLHAVFQKAFGTDPLAKWDGAKMYSY